MASITAGTWCRAARARSGQLLRDSRTRIAFAEVLIDQSLQAMQRQNFLRFVCAWCQTTLRFERAMTPTLGQVSHSICYACFAPLMQELAPGAIPAHSHQHRPDRWAV